MERPEPHDQNAAQGQRSKNTYRFLWNVSPPRLPGPTWWASATRRLDHSDQQQELWRLAWPDHRYLGGGVIGADYLSAHLGKAESGGLDWKSCLRLKPPEGHGHGYRDWTSYCWRRNDWLPPRPSSSSYRKPLKIRTSTDFRSEPWFAAEDRYDQGFSDPI